MKKSPQQESSKFGSGKEGGEGGIRTVVRDEWERNKVIFVKIVELDVQRTVVWIDTWRRGRSRVQWMPELKWFLCHDATATRDSNRFWQFTNSVGDQCPDLRTCPTLATRMNELMSNMDIQLQRISGKISAILKPRKLTKSPSDVVLEIITKENRLQRILWPKASGNQSIKRERTTKTWGSNKDSCALQSLGEKRRTDIT